MDGSGGGGAAPRRRSPSPDEAASLLAACAGRWWIAGGHAIERFVGHRLREHADIDLGCFRDAWPHLRRALGGWECHAAKDRVLTLLDDDAPPQHTQVVWCRPSEDSPWTLEFLLEDRDGATWRFRRDPRVRRAVDELTFTSVGTSGALRVLRPEIQLLYKAKHLRPKDEADFAAAAPAMDASDRAWLRDALTVAHPGHAWIERLG